MAHHEYFGARYYSSALGRFMTPDWSVAPEPIPYANLENPQSLNLYAYVLNNPVTSTDADGHYSDLIYDGATHTLTLVDKNGKVVGSWPAGDNVDSHMKIGKLVDGTYTFEDTTKANMHYGPDALPAGSIGPFGVFRLNPFIGADGGKPHTGVGVHAGREGATDKAGRTGTQFATDGCVRTCGPAMIAITKLAATDLLQTLKVENNREPGTCKEKTTCGQPASGTAGADAGTAGTGKQTGGGAELLLLSYHQQGRMPKRGVAEHVLSGINVYTTALPEVIAAFGNPAHFEETTNADYPKGSGERAYTWHKDGVVMTISTVFRTDKKTGSVIESYVQTVDVSGHEPAGLMGVTGAGLKLGDTRADAVRAYGHVEQGRTPRDLAVNFEDGTFLAIDLGPDGRIIRLHLDTNPE